MAQVVGALERNWPRNVFGPKRKEVRGLYVVMLRNCMICSRLKKLIG